MELAEVWCRSCERPATGADFRCDACRDQRWRDFNCDDECLIEHVPGDEPHGAGADYWNRPLASTHPEFWTE